MYEEKAGKKAYSFIAKSPVNTTNVMRVLLPEKPEKVSVSDANGQALAGAVSEWDEASKTCLLKFENDPAGISVSFVW